MTTLRRQLGLGAVMAIVMGDMLGSGIFFTPGELARVAEHPWQVYFIWSLAGLIVLCGALTLGELASLFPRAGATYHIMSEAFGPAWGFVKVWMEAWVSAPGSIAGIAIVFGEFVVSFLGESAGPAQIWGIIAVTVFAGINLMGVEWGGRTQVILTTIKITGLLILVGGSYLLAEAVAPSGEVSSSGGGLPALLRFVGLGVAAVFFTIGSVFIGSVAMPTKSKSRTTTKRKGVAEARSRGRDLVARRLPRQRPPTHPGEMLLEEFLKPLGISQSAFAIRLGVSFPRLNEIIRGKRAVTPDTALRLAQVLGMPADFWLGLQQDCDLWHAMRSERAAEIEQLEPVSCKA